MDLILIPPDVMKTGTAADQTGERDEVQSLTGIKLLEVYFQRSGRQGLTQCQQRLDPKYTIVQITFSLPVLKASVGTLF